MEKRITRAAAKVTAKSVSLPNIVQSLTVTEPKKRKRGRPKNTDENTNNATSSVIELEPSLSSNETSSVGHNKAVLAKDASDVAVQKGGRKKGTTNGKRGGGKGTRDVDQDLNCSFHDDPTSDEKLQARDGCLGIVTNRGFEARTNFLLEVHALINSITYKLKGYIFKLSFTSGVTKYIYVKEDAIYTCAQFKQFFDKQEPTERMLLLVTGKSWGDLMRKLILSFPSTRVMHFVENIGLQVRKKFK